LREHAESARLYRRLTRIALDAPVESSAEALVRQRSADKIESLSEQLRFGPLTRNRLRALCSAQD
jgi:DNA polymerase-1